MGFHKRDPILDLDSIVTPLRLRLGSSRRDALFETPCILYEAAVASDIPTTAIVTIVSFNRTPPGDELVGQVLAFELLRLPSPFHCL